MKFAPRMIGFVASIKSAVLEFQRGQDSTQRDKESKGQRLLRKRIVFLPPPAFEPLNL
jgi:hypothetical protein